MYIVELQLPRTPEEATEFLARMADDEVAAASAGITDPDLLRTIGSIIREDFYADLK